MENIETQMLYDLNCFLKLNGNKRGPSLVTAIIKPPKVAEQMSFIVHKHGGGLKATFDDGDHQNGVILCVAVLEGKPYYDFCRPWWRVDKSLIKVGKSFAVEEIRKAVPEETYGVITVEPNSLSFIKLGNDCINMPGFPATFPDVKALLKRKNSLVPEIMEFRGLHVLCRSNISSDLERIQKWMRLGRVARCHTIAEDVNVSIQQSDVFNQFPSPVVKDWMAIRKVLNPQEEFGFGPHDVIAAVMNDEHEGDVIIWSEERRKIYRYRGEGDDVRVVFSDVELADRLQEAGGEAWFRREAGPTPTLIEHLRVLMAGSLNRLRIIHNRFARSSPFVTQFQGIAVKLQARATLANLPLLQHR